MMRATAVRNLETLLLGKRLCFDFGREPTFEAAPAVGGIARMAIGDALKFEIGKPREGPAIVVLICRKPPGGKVYLVAREQQAVAGEQNVAKEVHQRSGRVPGHRDDVKLQTGDF